MHNYLLFGGGLDSSALALYLCATCGPENVTLCHVTYGQKAARPERRVTKHFAATLGCRYVLLHSDMRYSRASIMANTAVASDRNDNRLELRNPLLTLTVASYIASTTSPDHESTIHLGFHHELDGVFPDAMPLWFDAMKQVIRNASAHTIQIEAPFSGKTRTDIAAIGYKLRADFFRITHTCYEAKECGQCKHCQEKAEIQKAVMLREDASWSDPARCAVVRAGNVDSEGK